MLQYYSAVRKGIGNAIWIMDLPLTVTVFCVPLKRLHSRQVKPVNENEIGTSLGISKPEKKNSKRFSESVLVTCDTCTDMFQVKFEVQNCS